MTLSNLLDQVKQSHPNASLPKYSDANIEKQSYDAFIIYKKNDMINAPMVILTQSKTNKLLDDIDKIELLMAIFLAQKNYIVVVTADEKGAFEYLQTNAIALGLNYKEVSPKINLAAVVDVDGLEFFKNMIVLDMQEVPPTIEVPYWLLDPWFDLTMGRCEEFIYKHIEK